MCLILILLRILHKFAFIYTMLVVFFFFFPFVYQALLVIWFAHFHTGLCFTLLKSL